MCGILGLSPKIEVKKFKDALNSLSRRGPDAKSYIELNNCMLGHTRLSIIDLTNNANQPMQDISKRFTIVFNGEIYNYKELKSILLKDYDEFRTQSDTEVILVGFKYFGVNFFEKLQGMFAFSIHDSLTDEIILVRDRLGIKPLLYFANIDQLIFASELKPFKLISDKFNGISSSSVTDLLKFGSICQPNTIIQSIQQLPPGCILTWRQNKPLIINKYVEFNVELNYKLSYDETKLHLRKLLEKATKLHMVGDVEVGCFLSAGIDSTAVLGLMQNQVDLPIHAFSLGFENQEDMADETQIAENSAKLIGARFTRKIVTDIEALDLFDDYIDSIDQPSIDGFNTFLISKVASEHVKVVLTGLGGDELFGGYPHFKSIFESKNNSANLLDKFLSRMYETFPNRFTHNSKLRLENLKGALSLFRTYFHRREISNILVSGYIDNKTDNIIDSGETVSSLEVKNYLLNTLLRDSDVIGMWHGLELRPILLDQDVVNFALSIPDSYKVNKGLLKSIFIDSVIDLLPSDVLNRKKTGFELPFVKWMNGIMNERILKLWDSGSAILLFKKSFLSNIKSKTKLKKLEQKDWILVILISWVEKRLS